MATEATTESTSTQVAEGDWSQARPDFRAAAGVIIYDESADEVVAYLRDNKPGIPHPNTVSFFGGVMEQGESPEDTVRREVAEELRNAKTDEPLALDRLELFAESNDYRGLRFTLFGATVDGLPELKLKEREGQGIMRIGRAAIMADEIYYHDGRRVHFSLDYLKMVQNFLS